MERKRLHARLEQLHRDLQAVDSLDDRERALLEAVRSDIRALLAHEEHESEERYHDLRHQLRARIARLEAEHPRATRILGETMDALAGIGL